VSASDERQRNGEKWPRPFGLRRKLGHTALSASTLEPPKPSASALSGPIYSRNADYPYVWIHPRACYSDSPVVSRRLHGPKSRKTRRPAPNRHSGFLKASPAAATTCINLTSFNSPSPGRIRIAEETAAGQSSQKPTMRALDSAGDRNTMPARPVFRPQVLCWCCNFPLTTVPFRGIGANTGDSS